LNQIAICARAFGAVLKLSNLDVSLFQEASTVGTTARDLEALVPEVVAHLCELMSDDQKQWHGFDRWYRVMMDVIVFGDEENPIEVEE
jgi:hypothetical protein